MQTKLSLYDIERIRKAASLLRKHLTHNWTILELSYEVRLTDKKLKAGFKQEYSMGPHAYLRNARIDLVKKKLVAGQPIRTILKETGFGSESGLSKTFKKVVGVTPTEFKNNPELWDAAIEAVYQEAINKV
jgi:AraC-like DNA-binding protein